MKQHAIKHLGIGAVCYLIGLAILTLCIEVLRLSYIQANVIAFVVLIFLGHLFNRRLNYGSQLQYVPELFRYILSSIVLLFISTGLAMFMIKSIGAHYLIANMVSTAAATILAFIINVFFVFRRRVTKIDMRTNEPEYYIRLLKHQKSIWKKILNVQLPYRWHLRSLKLGRTLEVGCGIGRNLVNLYPNAEGVDHNIESVAFCRNAGLMAYLPPQFHKEMILDPSRKFDSLLFSHIAEHMNQERFIELFNEYRYALMKNGRVVLITPQAAGYKSDPTHVNFLDLNAHKDLCISLGFELVAAYSFPFPEWVGSLFVHNEYVSIWKFSSEDSPNE